MNIIQTENQNIPLGEIDEGDTTYLLRSQGQFENLDEIRLVVLTKNSVPVDKGHRRGKDSTEDFRAFTRINGKPGVRLRVREAVRRKHGPDRRGGEGRVARINREMPGIRLTMLDDQSVFIDRAIDSVKEHAIVGSVLVILVIFLFLRDFRATLIVCTSIPISVVGTFALLYFCGFTLNTMTFGGLALGIGMIVERGDRRAREHLSAHGNGQAARAGGHRRKRGGLVGDRGVDAHAHRRVHPAALPDRCLEHSLHAAVDHSRHLPRCRCRSS